jgi:hypothetical protein
MQYRLRGEIERPAFRGWHDRGPQILRRLEDSYSTNFLNNFRYVGPMSWILIGPFNADPDPSFHLNAAPDLYPESQRTADPIPDSDPCQT